MTSIRFTFPLAKELRTISAPYTLEPVAGLQNRLRGRERLKPDIDLRLYKAKCVYDWVEIRVALHRKTQFQHIQRLLKPIVGRRLRVEAIGAGSDGTSNVFTIRFQDPSRAMVTSSVEAVDEKWTLVGEVRVVAIEIAVDFYPLSGEREERELLSAILQHHFLPRGLLNRLDRQARRDRRRASRGPDLLRRLQQRQSWSRGRYGTDILRPDAGYHLAPDATLYVGPKDSDYAWRVQDKVSNHRKGEKADALGPTQWRSRVEITLRAASLVALGIQNLDDLYALKGEELASDHFSFWTPTVPALTGGLPHARGLIRSEYRKQYLALFEEIGVIGCIALDFQRSASSLPKWLGKSRRALRLGATGFLTVWIELNDKVRHSLAHLRL